MKIIYIFEKVNFMKNCSIVSALVIILSSCASTYKSLRPSSSYFGNTEDINGIKFSYKHGVLAETGNKKYAKREVSKAIKVVSVKIINNSDKTLVIGQNAKFYSGNSELRLIEPSTIHHQLKQGVPIYLLYLLLTPTQLTTGSSTINSNGTISSASRLPIGLILGPGIAFGNMAVAGTANQNFLRELNEYNLINKTITPGQTVFGLIGVNDIGYNPVRIVVD
ncbi:MAG: hypothetical protein KA713_21095 [Chryseotalea sp. WA131a]|nr:MAG: hypothetical protein KA713_21095 [Chryseotalea sp. WA131a]